MVLWRAIQHFLIEGSGYNNFVMNSDLQKKNNISRIMQDDT